MLLYIMGSKAAVWVGGEEKFHSCVGEGWEPKDARAKSTSIKDTKIAWKVSIGFQTLRVILANFFRNREFYKREKYCERKINKNKIISRQKKIEK